MEFFRFPGNFIGVFILILGTTAEPISLEYHFINRTMTWNNAQSYCRINYNDLATVNHMEDHARLLNLLEITRSESRQSEGSWIGLYRLDTRSWKWSDGSGTAQYTNWKTEEPSNGATSGWCMEMSQNGNWNDVSCEDENNYVCYESNDQGQVRFVRYSTMVSWTSGQAMCRKNHKDLATVWNAEINAEIQSLVTPGYQVWTGLFSDAWRWSGGSDVSYRSWLEGFENDGNCAAASMVTSARWTAQNCNNEAMFVCEGDLMTHKTLIKMKFSTDLVLTESTHLAITEQLRSAFRSHTIYDFKLQWRQQ